ncbi:MAG: GxxExxY protein [Sulfuricaulis sp.]|uniref:GxxExxY protein n=1 Tax=Sulfuricaulis sp. TaxID=2003553 RepID=UPI0025CFE7A3|nr:GxxExxY protein [Sulfuricaulis sp.]MCR4347749.1 GxxExxY protein [Sulfuricaulis sp.]
MNCQDAKTPEKGGQNLKKSRIEPDKRLDQLASVIVDAALEVHRYLGPGYLESIYEEALAVELTLRNLPFVRQISIPVRYKGQSVGQGRLDFLIDGALVVELKAVDALHPVHKAQVISYLKATGHQLGLLMNFNVPVLSQGIQRIVYSK